MIAYDPRDWASHLLDVQGSMFREIIGRVATCVAWSAVVVLIHRHVYPLDVPSTVHGYVGIVLSLLLVFRTNASYDRFWDGRRQWGSIINETRNLARAVSVHLRARPELRDEVLRWADAFAYATMFSLRGKKSIGPLEDRLPTHDVDAVVASQHVPLAVATKITERLVRARDEGHLSDFVFLSLDQNVQLLIDYLGACERIHKTPLPFPYVVHLRRCLILFCFTLPFALLSTFSWRTIPATLLVAYTFFGIEEIGVEIEDPFGTDVNDLPLDVFCTTIDQNLSPFIGSATSADGQAAHAAAP